MKELIKQVVRFCHEKQAAFDGCFTGDCPHELEDECCEAVAQEFMKQTTIPAGDLPSPEENPDGLHARYVVLKSDGATSPNAKYLVMRLDHLGSDPLWTANCRRYAMLLGEEILSDLRMEHLHQMARELIELCDKENAFAELRAQHVEDS